MPANSEALMTNASGSSIQVPATCAILSAITCQRGRFESAIFFSSSFAFCKHLLNKQVNIDSAQWAEARLSVPFDAKVRNDQEVFPACIRPLRDNPAFTFGTWDYVLRCVGIMRAREYFPLDLSNTILKEFFLLMKFGLTRR